MFSPHHCHSHCGCPAAAKRSWNPFLIGWHLVKISSIKRLNTRGKKVDAWGFSLVSRHELRIVEKSDSALQAPAPAWPPELCSLSRTQIRLPRASCSLSAACSVRSSRLSVCREKKAHLEVSLTRYMKGSKRDSYQYLNCKRKKQGDEVRDMKTKDMKKAEVIDAFFYLSFVRKTSLQESQSPRTRGEVWTKEYFLSVEVDQVRNYLNHLNTHSSSSALTDEQERLLRTGRKQMLTLSSELRIQGRAGLLAHLKP